MYEKALKISGLATDLEKLPNKDLTMVGEKGINMSGALYDMIQNSGKSESQSIIRSTR